MYLPLLRWICWSCAWLYFLLPCHAQPTDISYPFLRSQAPIPQDFLNLTYDSFIQHLSIPESNKLIQGFYQTNYYQTRELLSSGKILFHDPASEYVSRVADILLENQPELRKKLKFHVLRSSTVNAYTTSNGYILVNVGLLAHLKNEAQLAYILSHEISHFVSQDPLKIFLNRQPAYSQGLFKPKDRQVENSIIEKLNYSKEIEETADKEGLNIFLESSYAPVAAVEIFDLLLDPSSFAPVRIFHPDSVGIDSINFETDFLEMMESQGLSDGDFASPLASTHPSPKKRKLLIRRKVKPLFSSSKPYFIQAETLFEDIKARCQLELCSIFLEERKYENAFLWAYRLRPSFSNTSYLDRVTAHALYGIAEYSNAGKFWDIHEDAAFMRGENKKVATFFELLSDESKHVLALLYLYDVWRKEPTLETQKKLHKLLMAFIQIYFSEDYFQVLKTSPNELQSDQQTFRTALSTIWEEKDFYSLIQSLPKSNPSAARPIIVNTSANSQDKAAALQGVHLGLDSLIYIDPFFQIQDTRMYNLIDYKKSAQKEIELEVLLQEYSEQVGIHHQVLTPHRISPQDIDTYQNVMALKAYIREKTQHDELDMMSLYYTEMQKMAEDYQTPYFVWTGGLSYTQPRSSKPLILGAGIIFPPALPYSLYYALSPRHDFLFYTFVYHIQEDRPIFIYPRWIKLKPAKDVMHSTIYDVISQLK
ncbi:MAG: M48 family metallopeptidase [Bacteroidota bacterium]